MEYKRQPKDIMEKHQEKVDALRCMRTLIEDHKFEGERKSTIVCQDGKTKRVTDGAAIVHKEINNTLSKRTRKVKPGADLRMFTSVSVSDSNIPEELPIKTLTFINETLGGRTGTHTFFVKQREKTTAKLYGDLVDMAEQHLGVSKDGYDAAEIAAGAYLGRRPSES
jgi:hypothetical protein